MPNFDFDSYIDNRFGGDRSGKIAELMDASKAKVESLGVLSAQIDATREANKNSWASRVTDNPEGGLGTLANQAATLYEAGGREVGQMLGAPALARNASDEMLMAGPDFAAYSKYVKGTATSEDMALLGQRKVKPVVLGVDPLSDVVQSSGDNLTTLERFQRMDNDRQFALDVKARTDFKAAVHGNRRDTLNNQLGDTFDTNKAQVAKGWDAGLSGAGDVLAGSAKMLGGALGAIGDNKVAATEAITAQVPQIAMALMGKGGKAAQVGSNFGYAAQNYAEGIANFQKENNGAYPSDEKRHEMAMYAASLAVAEHVGEASTIKALLPKGTSKAVVEAAGDATRTGFKKSLLGMGAAITEGVVGEGATEAYQTWAEGKASNKDVSGRDIFTGGVLGALAGGGISGGGRVLAEAAGTTPEDVAQREQKASDKAIFDTAVKTGDTSVYTDPTAQTYNPGKAVGVLFQHSQLPEATAETKQTNLAKADDLIAGLEDTVADAKGNVAFVKKPLADKQAQLEAMKAALAAETDPEIADARQKVIAEREAMMGDVSPSQVKLQQQKTDRMEAELVQAKKVRDGLSGLVQTAQTEADVTAQVEQANAAPDVAESRMAADKVMTLAMHSPDSLTPEAANTLASNVGNSFTDAERTQLKTFAAARIAENKLKDMGTVAQQIYTGSAPGAVNKFVGIAEYRNNLVTALRSGSKEKATAAVDGIIKFADGHSNKAEVASDAFETYGKGVIILKSPVGGWQVSDKAMSARQVNDEGGYTLNSLKLVDQFKVEADALKAASAEMTAMFEQAYNPKIVDKKVVAPVAVQSTTSQASPPSLSISPKENAEVEPRPVEATVPSKEVQKETVATTVESGKLKAIEPVASTGLAYKARNLLADSLQQSAGGDTAVTERPLVAVKDFLSQLASGTVDLKDFIKDKAALSAKQSAVVQDFVTKAKEWSATIQKNLVKAKNPDYRYTDLVQFLLQENLVDGKSVLDLEENVKTAISLVAYNAVADDAGFGPTNSPADINKILLRDEDTDISAMEWATFGDRLVRENVWRNAAGQKVVQALGLKTNKTATTDLMPRLESALGAHVEKLMMDLGLLKRKEISAKDMAMFMGEDSVTGGATTNLVGLVWEKGALPAVSQQILDASKSTQQILSKVFSVESSVQEPTLEPTPFSNKTTDGTKEGIPAFLKKVLDQKQAEAHYLQQDKWILFNTMSEDMLLQMAGEVSEDSTITHAANRAKNQAKNAGLLREIRLFKEFVEGTLTAGKEGIESPFYLQYSVWKQQRVGVISNAANPQMSKVHRYMMFRKGWETKISLDNQAQMDNFKLRVLEGLGTKTDKQANAVSLPLFERIFEGSADADTKQKELGKVLNTAIDALVKGTLLGQDLSTEEQVAIVAGVKAGGEKFHTLDVLTGMAAYRFAQQNKAGDFTARMMGEVDGVNNGPMLSSFLYGAAASVKSMFSRLNRGGFFQVNDAQTQYNQWRGTPGNFDLYETTAMNMMRAARSMMAQDASLKPVFAAVEAFTKPLEKNGVATKEGRGIIKTPINAIHFGSGVQSSAKSMAASFVEGIYERMEKATQPGSSDTAAAIQRDINTLLKMAGAPLIPGKPDLQALLDTQLTGVQESAVKQAFLDTLGKATEKTLKADFGAYLSQRDTFNKVAQLSFELYNAVAQGMRKEYIDQLMDAHDDTGEGIPYSKRTDKATGKTVREPLHALTAEQESILAKRTEKLRPLLQTAMSKSDNRNTGILMAKPARTISDSSAYAGEVKFGTPVKGYKSYSSKAKGMVDTMGMNTRGFERVEENPSVGMGSKSVHSFDSSISHTTQLGNEVTNFHDALGAGLSDFQRIAGELNQNTWKGLLDYSPIQEMYTSYVQVLTALDGMATAGELSADVAKGLVAAIDAFASKQGDVSVGMVERMLNTIKELAYKADAMKYSTLAETAVVDQYALEGGNYVVTDADRAEAKAKQEALVAEVPQATLELAQRLDALMGNAGAVATQEKANKKNQDKALDAALDSTVATLPTVQVVQLLEHGSTDKTLTEAVQGQMATVMDKMLADGSSIKEALVSELTANDAVALMQLLAERHAAIPANAWGDIGPSMVGSDPYLVKLLEQRGSVSGKQMLMALQNKPGMTGFDLKLIKLLNRTIPANLQVTYITPATAPGMVLGGKVDKARGWYTLQGDQNQIYVLSPEHTNSGITAELMMHELLHSALTWTIENERVGGGTNSHATELVNELESLRKLAESYAKEKGLYQKYGNALKDVHELMAWGLTNRDFQTEVLIKVQMHSKTKGNALVTLMQGFIDAISKFMFRNPVAQETSGLAVLISNTSGLFAEAAKVKQYRDLQVTNAMATASSAIPVSSYTTEQLFDALGAGLPDSSFDNSVKAVLNGLVSKLHGPFGSFKESLMDRAVSSPVDILTNAIASGIAPFASKVFAAGFTVNDKEAFVMEQVEATVRASLEDASGPNHNVYRELSKLYMEVKGKLKPADFHQGDWATATSSEVDDATALHDFIFKIEATNGNKTDHLSRFAAMGLSHEGFNTLLQVATDRNSKSVFDKMGFGARLQMLFDKVLELFNGKMTNTRPGQQADEKLTALVEQLVNIETKKRKLLTQKAHIGMGDKFDEAVKVAADKAKTKLEQLGSSAFFQKNQNTFVKLGGNVISTVAGNRVMVFMGGLAQMRSANFDTRAGLLGGLVQNVLGPLESFQKLLRASKLNERDRKHVMGQTTKFVLDGFANGSTMSKATKAAVSAVFLRTGAHALIGHFDMGALDSLLRDTQARGKAIADFEAKLSGFGNRDYFVNQAKVLGYKLATGKSKGVLAMQNAGNIARLYGTGKNTTLTNAQIAEAEGAIDVLATLYALSYSKKEHLVAASELLRAEINRTDNKGNGVEGVLLTHKSLEQQARERLFSNNEALMMKGYSPEIYNPYIDIAVAPLDASGNSSLMDLGYSLGAAVEHDAADTNQAAQFIHVMRDGGKQPLLTGILSYTGMHAKGTAKHNGNMSFFSAAGQQNQLTMQNIAAAKQAGIQRMFTNMPGFDPSKEVGNHMSPVLNSKGEAVNWRYMMSENTKDTLLERDNRFEEIMGSLAGSIYDKETAPEQNRTAVEALHENYLAGFGSNPKEYLKVGPTSPDPEMREIWRLLPETTKKDVRAVWGKDEMMVRSDLLDITFGYHKLSLSTVFEKDEADRNVFENSVVLAVEMMLEASARAQNVVRKRQGLVELDPQTYARRAAMVVRKHERIWQEIVKEAKEIIVVKSGVTMVGNITSNTYLLKMYGVSLLDIVKHHQVGMRAARDYQRDNNALSQLQLQVDTGFGGGNLPEVQSEITRLKDSLARNPVKVLIDAGLMPTIAEDTAGEENVYSFKSKLARKATEVTAGLNPSVVRVGKAIYMAKDTGLHQALSHITQLSDFVARYTLYQHLTTKSNKPLTSEAAIQEASDAFINYDIPMHRSIQYLDDMGIFMFTKYFINIQRVIARLVRDHPGQVIEAILMKYYFNMLPNTVLDSSAIHRIGHNPFNWGAFQYPSTLDELATVKSGLSLFK